MKIDALPSIPENPSPGYANLSNPGYACPNFRLNLSQVLLRRISAIHQ